MKTQIYLAVIFALFFLSLSAKGAVIDVSNTNDSGAGSLRQAIADASPGDVITFSVTGTISLSSAPLSIGKNLTITGPGANLLTISGMSARQVMIITTGTVTVSGLKLTNGSGGGSEGGTLRVTGGTITVNDC